MKLENNIITKIENSDIPNLIIPACATGLDVSVDDHFLTLCDVTSISVEEGNTTFVVKGNCLINTKTKTLVLGCADSVIPDDGSVEVIGEKAFAMRGGDWANNALKQIVIPSTVKRIGYQAFASTELESVVIPKSVEYIDSFAFEGNIYLENVIFEGECTVKISAFSGCSKLNKIEIAAPLKIYKYMLDLAKAEHLEVLNQKNMQRQLYLQKLLGVNNSTKNN